MPKNPPKHDKLKIFSERGWLSLTSSDFRASVLERLAVYEFQAGDPIYRLQDPAGGLWGIVKGSIEAEMPGPTGPSLGHFGTPGLWFGEGTVINSSPRRTGVSATCPSTLAHLSLADCQSLLAADPYGWRWIALLSTMTTDLALRLASDLMLRAPDQRTAAMLLRLAGLRNGMFLKPHIVPINLSHEKLGILANLSRNAINPILKDFEHKGLVRISYRSIENQDVDGLSKLLTQ